MDTCFGLTIYPVGERNNAMSDIFRPSHEPARTIYDAFQDEAKKRKDQADWIEKERQRVWAASRDCSQMYGLKVLTLEDVRRAENLACGHTDYGAKWAYGIVAMMRGEFP
jgi:hypothetical protein